MKYFKNFLFIGFFYIALNQILIEKIYAERNTNSIIKMFCIENVKAEMLKANLIYQDGFGQDICDCYLENILNNIGHEESISKCKQENNKKIQF